MDGLFPSICKVLGLILRENSEKLDVKLPVLWCLLVQVLVLAEATGETV